MRKVVKVLIACMCMVCVLILDLPLSVFAVETCENIDLSSEWNSYRVRISQGEIEAIPTADNNGRCYCSAYRIVSGDNQIYPLSDSNTQIKMNETVYNVAVESVSIPQRDFYILSNEAEVNAINNSMGGEQQDYEVVKNVNSYNFSSVITILTLKLKYEGVEYIVRYANSPSGEDGFTYSEYSYIYGTSIKFESIESIAQNAPDGNSLVGWAITPNGDVQYPLDSETTEPVGLQETEVEYMLTLYPVFKNLNEPSPSPKPKSPSAPAAVKKNGTATVGMSDYYYGNTSVQPVVTSKTNDAAKASIAYKPALSADTEYSATRPTKIGKYTVRATLPANDSYEAVTVTSDFKVSYMPIPNPGATANHETNAKGWFTESTALEAPKGYAISLNQNSGYSNSIALQEGKQEYKIFYRNSSGEISESQTLKFQMDTVLPNVVCVENMKENDQKVLFGTEAQLIWEEDNPVSIQINGEAVQWEKDKPVNITIGKKIEEYTIIITDEAGNKSESKIYAGPEWMLNGVIPEGDIYLENEETYEFDEGKWQVSGDKNTYLGGHKVYVVNGGDYTIVKNK